MEFRDIERRAPPSVLPQRQSGFMRVRCGIPAGDMQAGTLERLCAIADEYGSGEIRCGPRHEIEIPSVRQTDVDAVVAELSSLALRVVGELERPNVVACPGADECEAAYVKTKKLCHDIEAFLSEAMQDGPLPPAFRVALSGCPNECSQAHVNDVGFVGAVGSYGGRKLRGFELVVGGSVRGEGRLGERIAFLAPEDVVPTLRDLIEVYRERGGKGMMFADFLQEYGPGEMSRELERKLSQRMWFFEI